MILYDNVDDTWKYVESCIYRQILFDYFKIKLVELKNIVDKRYEKLMKDHE